MNPNDRLDALEEVLRSFAAVDEGFFVSDFDGFCTGLIVSPQMVPPSEWLPVVWGTPEPPAFENEQEMEAALDLIMAHYNEVAIALSPPNFELGPIYEQDTRTDEMLWEGWVFGFEQAMRLRPDGWQEIVESGDEEAAASSVLLMLELYNISDGKSELSAAQIDDLTERAPALIPELVFSINRRIKNNTRAKPK
ncbi:MAG: UPF0149 family protein [Sulfitobacter sp.]